MRRFIARRWQLVFVGVVSVGLVAGFTVDVAATLVAAPVVGIIVAVMLWLDRRISAGRHSVSAPDGSLADLVGRITALDVRIDVLTDRVDISNSMQGQLSTRINDNEAQIAAAATTHDHLSLRIEQDHAGLAERAGDLNRFAARLEQTELAVSALGGRVEQRITAAESRSEELGEALDDLTLRSANIDGDGLAIEPRRLTPTRRPRTIPVVSVIVTCRHTRRLRACLESIANQDFDDFECVVVGVGPTDPVAIDEVLAELADPRFWVLRGEGHWSMAEARNTSVAGASGEFCVVVESDDRFHQGSLRSRLHDSWTWDHRRAGTTCAWSHAGAGDEASPHAVTMPELVCSGSIPYLPLAAVLLRTDVVKAIGGFNESITHGGDHEFLTRLLRHRFILGHVEHLGLRARHTVGDPDVAAAADYETAVADYLARPLREDEIGGVDHAVLEAPIAEYRGDLDRTQRLATLLTLASLRGDTDDIRDLLRRFPTTIDLLPESCLDIPGVVDRALDRFAWTNSGRPSAEAAALHHRVRRQLEQLRTEAADRRAGQRSDSSHTDVGDFGKRSGVGAVTWRGDEWSRVHELRGDRSSVSPQ